MNEVDIITPALERLEANTGIRAQWTNLDPGADGAIDFHVRGKDVHYIAEVKRELRDYQVPQLIEMAGRYENFMVVAERIFPNLKEKLRENHIGYLDGAGNIYIDTGDRVVWLDGQKPIEPGRPVTNRAFTKAGLKVVFCLLADPEVIRGPYRVLAKAADVGLGNINNVMQGLKDAGFILELGGRRLRLQHKQDLLKRWIAGYKETLKPAILQGRYRFFHQQDFAGWKNLPAEPGQTFWGGEPAAEMLTDWLIPQDLTIYTTGPKGRLVPLWKLVPDTTGNIGIYEKFWELPNLDRQPFTPYVLVYADLMATGDPRCLEAAGMIYDKYLKDEFERD